MAVPENETVEMELTTAPVDTLPFSPNFWRDETLISNDGPLIVFYSDNHPGHHANIGAIRLPKMSPPRLPDYIAHNYKAIKQMAMFFWHRYNSFVNNANGFGQKLVLDDFGLDFVIRHNSTSYCPDRRNEIGLWAANYPNLLSYSDLSGPLNGTAEMKDLVLFGHIYLYDDKKRRTVQALEASTAAAKPSPNGKIGTHVVEPKDKFPPGHALRRNNDKKTSKKRSHQGEPGPQGSNPKKAQKVQDVEQWKEKNFAAEFPALPKAAKTPSWPKDGKIKLSAALPEY